MHLSKAFAHRTVFLLVAGLLILSLLAGCQNPSAQPANAVVDMGNVLKAVENAQGGWKPQEAVKSFDTKNLFELMDGQSDAFFVYGFEKAAVQRFNNSAGITLVVSLYQVDTPDSAYGLFSVNGDPQRISIGSGGGASPGRRLSFWQSRYFVQMTALKAVPEADLMAVGQAISAGLPKGGETPALVTGLTQKGLSGKPGPLFFHQELSIQDRIWLGGENKLGLGLDTNGVLARYDLSGRPFDLMIIEFPDASRAQKALQALQASGQEELLAAATKNKRLAAVFGKGDKSQAEGLLSSISW